jgi:hypothetical protein
MEEYDNLFTQDDFFDFYVTDFVWFFKNIKPFIRKKINGSCFHVTSEYNITKDITGKGLYSIFGTLHVKIIFKSNDTYFAKPWWKKIFTRK